MEQQEQLTPQQHQELIKSNIFGSYNNPEQFLEKSNIIAFDELIKGDISNNFSYKEAISIIKKGKDIKQQLSLLLIQHQSEYSNLQDKLNQLSLEVGQQPTSPTTTDWYDVKVDYAPLRYNWDIIDTSNGEQKDKMYQYNQLVDKVIDCQIEQKMIDTMLKNLDDNKDYPLSVKQVVALNF